MYSAFYGLDEIPFGLSPDPRYLFKTDSYLESISSLRYGLASNKGLVVMVGEVGTGKTLTLRSMLQQLDRDVLAVYVFNPFLTAAEFFEQLLLGLGLEAGERASKPELLRTLGSFLVDRHAKGKRTVLIVDEAHGLAPDVLEEIRLLSNFETNSEKLLQIVLCGQPELREALNRPGLRQLKQRISLRCVVKPLEAYEVTKYIRFRLKVAGAERVNIFNAEATDIICRASLGVPRVINNICDNALLYGYAAGRDTITPQVIEEVIESLDISLADGARPADPVGPVM
jgi:general secretion pathway protein A